MYVPDPLSTDEVLALMRSYPASLPDDPYWPQDLREALSNRSNFIEPGDNLKYVDYRYAGAHNAFTYPRFYPAVGQQDQTIIGQLTFGMRGLMLDTWDWTGTTSVPLIANPVK